MSDGFTRTHIIRAEEGATDGIVQGTLMSNGETSDGHIVDIQGHEAAEGAPLLFGHDDFSGTRNLGSWLSFARIGARRMRDLGDQELRGVAQIEIEKGVGANRDFRQDIAMMIDAGHIRMFSARGTAHPDEAPVRRVNLPRDHPAYIDDAKVQGMQRYGLFFGRSRLVEGSIVTAGADRRALIRHIDGLQDVERVRPFLLELDISCEEAQALYRSALGIERVAPAPPQSDPEPSSETPIPPESGPETPSEEPAEVPAEPAPEPEPTPAAEPTAPLAEAALERIQSAFPEFVNEAPDLVREMTQEVFRDYHKELREKLDRYAYERLGRVPPR